VEYPLLIRLKMSPDYLVRRNRLLYEFLMGDGSYPSLMRRGLETLVKLAPELTTDPFWDAYRLLSRVDDYHRRMVRPMTMERAVLVFQSELVTYRQRARQLMRALEKNPLYARVVPTQEGEAKASTPGDATGPGQGGARLETRTKLELYVDGHSGAGLNRVRVKLPRECPSKATRLLQRDRVIASAELPDDLELHELALVPAVGIVARAESSATQGDIRSEPVQEKYELTFESACPVQEVEVHAAHLLT
jgi:hypothetical protein